MKSKVVTASESRPESRREIAKAERRARIVQAARELISETGDAGLSMRALAARAGVSLATPYNLFGSKRAILVTVLEDIKEFGTAFAASAKRPPFERLLKAVALAVSYYEQDPVFYRALWTTILGSEGAEDREAIFNPKRDAFWLGLLRESADAGLLREDVDMALLLRTLDYSFRATMLHWVIGEVATEQLQPSIGYAYALVLRGAASPAGSGLLDKPINTFQARVVKARAQPCIARNT
ncbi:MAG: TetR/AcrR family transcriptional regulator [Rhodoblastus sp.]